MMRPRITCRSILLGSAMCTGESGCSSRVVAAGEDHEQRQPNRLEDVFRPVSLESLQHRVLRNSEARTAIQFPRFSRHNGFALRVKLSSGKIPGMSVQELEAQVAALAPEQLAAFTNWFEEFVATAWDRRFESDAAAGKLDHSAKQADADFEAGRCTPL